jgi:hypothetical protein
VALLFLEFVLQELSHLAIFLGHLLQGSARFLMARKNGLSFAYELQVSIVWERLMVCGHWTQSMTVPIVPKASRKIRTPPTTNEEAANQGDLTVPASLLRSERDRHL